MKSTQQSENVHRPRQAGAGVVVIGVLVAVCCAVFAVVNLVFELTDHFADGRYAEYAAAFTVMNWLVICLKLLGAAVAWLSVTTRPPLLPVRLLAVLLWGAFATLAVYALGGVVEAIGILLDLTGTAEAIDLADVAYLLFFVLLAIGYGVLALSFSRRHRTRRRLAVLGLLGAPLVLGLVLVAVPMLLTALHIMPSS